MRTFQRLRLLLVIALALDATISAKCPTGTVTVRGRVDHLPSTATGVEATVLVESKNGTVSRTVSVSNGEFEAEVPFSTQSSSFFGNDRCHTVPTFVEVKIVLADKVYVQKRLNFKDSFEMTKLYEYRLKQELFLDVLKETVNSAK